ncbi:amidase [Orrella sp. JC864]|uniref:amidase n=1 Tax=Orrella sp. JC864 TaxID=3120298 RepID=UPI00300A7C0E
MTLPALPAAPLSEDLYRDACRAGLAQVARAFPEDLALAAQAVAQARQAWPADADPLAEPWPPMRMRQAPPAPAAAMTQARQRAPLPPASLPAPREPWHWLDAGQIAAAYRAGDFGPVELARALLERIDALDGGLHAFIDVDAGQVLAQARACEARLRAGTPRGPLEGVPVGIKDILDVAGQATTCHSLLRLDHRAAQDAFVVARLRQAGAVLMGKLALHEFAVGGPPVTVPFPSALNPWDRTRHPGGSSSGSGVALAAGLVPLALGTDTGGSVRNPAGHCGVAGLKPTYGLVSRTGAFPLSFTLDHIGPMARSVADLACLLDAIAAWDGADPACAPFARPAYGSKLHAGVAGLRIGLLRHFHEEDMPAHPEVAAAFEQAAQLLREAGARVCEARLPPLQRFGAAQRVIFQSEAWAIHAQGLRTRPQDYSPVARQKLLPGALLSAAEYVQAQQLRGPLMAAVDQALESVDVLMAVNSMDPPCRVDDAQACRQTYGRHARSPFNLTGHPALAVMAGLSGEGLPLSVQFVGRAFDEATVLQVGAEFERRAGWAGRHPPGL